MPLKSYAKTPAQFRKEYAEKAEDCLERSINAGTITNADRLVAKAQVYATLALAYKD